MQKISDAKKLCDCRRVTTLLLRLALLFVFVVPSPTCVADNCELDVRGYKWDPNPVFVGEATTRKVTGAFTSLQKKECQVTSESWEWEITRVDYNAAASGGTWAESAATLANVDWVDTGTLTTNLQSPTMRFKTGALDKTGRWRIAYRVRASYESVDCGKCDGTGWKSFISKEVSVVNILIESIQFNSDHGVLRDYTTDYNAGGELFKEPEWLRTVRNEPISHTKKTKVKVTVTIKGAASDTGTYKLRSPQFDGEKTITLTGGTGSAELTTKDPLQNKIERTSLAYDWEILNAAGTVVTSESTTHEAYLTYGTPRNTGNAKHQATLIRMRRAISYGGKGDPDDPFDIVLKAMKELGNFQQDNNDVINAWTVPDGKADCAEQSRFIKKVIYMIGLPGDVKTMLVYAVPAAPKTAIEEEWGVPGCKYGLNQDSHYDTTNPTWRAWLVAGKNMPNAFESTVRYTVGGTTKYFPGGVPGASHDTATEVLLQTFKGLGWYDTAVPNTPLGRGEFKQFVPGGTYP